VVAQPGQPQNVVTTALVGSLVRELIQDGLGVADTNGSPLDAPVATLSADLTNRWVSPRGLNGTNVPSGD